MTPDFADVEFCIDGDSSDTPFLLWREWHDALRWEQVNPGFSCQIGSGRNVAGKEMPVCVYVTYARLDGHLVAFVCGVSALVDHDAVDEWRRKTFENAKGVEDPLNFHNCLSSLGIEVEKSYRACAACGRPGWVSEESPPDSL